jgi:hypothetical protein
MDSPGRHVLYLARKIGARGAGSDGEAAAASYVMHTMEEFCDDVDRESFSSWKSDMPGLAATCIAAVAAFLFFPLSHTVCLLLSIVVFLIFQMETYTWPVVSRLFPRSNSANVVGRVHPEGERKNLVVLAANYDSARSSPLGRPGVARFFRVIYVLTFICIVLITVLGFTGVVGSLAKFSEHTLFNLWLVFTPFSAYLLVVSIAMLWGELFGRYSPGANDNASGVGVMLAALQWVSESRLDNTELWGVATGRGAAGGRGMVALLKRHPGQFKKACIINIDHPGRGKTVVFKREGSILGFSPNRRLKRLVLLAAAKTRDLDVAKGRCRVKKSDGMAAMVRWANAISVGGASGGTFDGWRRVDDVYHKIDDAALDRCLRLVQTVLEEIDGAQERRNKAVVHEPGPEA